MNVNRKKIADLIIERLRLKKDSIKQQYDSSKAKIGYFLIDDILPLDIAMEIYRQFPNPDEMRQRKNLRENKHVAAQMNQYHPILEETIFAFQAQKIVEFVKELCGIEDLYPDENLYAGGISSMRKGQFLNPHLDNSHDKDRDKWRVLNLLYYVSPDWRVENGGHLEIWPDGMEGAQVTLHSMFNRLIVMATHQTSWHSVSPVQVEASRNCVSNYYFSNQPLLVTDKFHVTTFRGRPEQKVRDKILQADSFLRMGVRKLFNKGVVKTTHVYEKDDQNVK